MEKEPVSPRPLGQLPKNLKTYVITSVGEVSYELGPTEPVWKIYFSRFKNHKQMDGEEFSIQLGGTLLRAGAVGSIWENRKNIGFLGTSWPRHIQLELPERVIEQTVVYRTDESGSINPVFLDKNAPDSRPYLLLRILGEPEADFVIISCFEVFRFYYAYLRSVCRHFFSFDKVGNNLKLFNPSTTNWNEKRTCFIFDPKPNISDVDQRRLAHYLVSKTARRAIGLTAASARAQFAKKEPVLPVCRVPIIGLNKWSVVGGIRTIRITSGSIESPLRVIAISRLIDCFDKGRVPAVLSLRERTIWRPKQKDKANKERKKKKSGPPPTTNQDLPAISDKPFGNRTRVNDKDSKNTSFDRECWNGVRYNRIGEKIEVELAQSADDEDIDPDAASSSNQGGGDPKIGRLGDTPPPPMKRESIVDPISEEEYRRNLEHIFHFKAPGQITSEEIEAKDLPESLTYLFHSATQFFDGAAKPLGCFLGGDSKMFYEDVVPVFVLDPNWGRNTRCRAAKDGVRRALVLEIPTEFGFLYFFDLEKKKGEKISIHAMLFNGRSMSTDQIASILYRRLEGREHRGWPKRKQYSGEFWSASLYHYDEISPEDRGAQISSFISHVGEG